MQDVMKGLSSTRYSGIVSAALFVALLSARDADPTHGSDDRVVLAPTPFARPRSFKQEPEYPAAARQFRVGGEVVAEFTVGVDGKVENIADHQRLAYIE